MRNIIREIKEHRLRCLERWSRQYDLLTHQIRDEQFEKLASTVDTMSREMAFVRGLEFALDCLGVKDYDELELDEPEMGCVTCNGKGIITNDDDEVPCDDCDGTGVVSWAMYQHVKNRLYECLARSTPEPSPAGRSGMG